MKRVLLFTSLLVSTVLSGKEFMIAKEGKTDYCIVMNGEKNEVNDFAKKELIHFLKKATGTEFKTSGTATPKTIFIGAPQTETATLKDQTYVIKTKGDCLYLYGNGMHGNLHAVYEYLERIAGIRWFSVYGDMKVPYVKELKHNELNIEGNYAFRIRSTQTYFYRNNPREATLFHYRNRQNLLLCEGNGVHCLEVEYTPSVHALSNYIHPGVDYYGDFEKTGRFHRQYDWIENKNYFKTNPEWFPMNKEGKRYTHGQLCFSNRAMRKELFKNAFTQLENEVKRAQTAKGIFTLDMTDIVYEEFCYCPECKKLNEKYRSKGGAFFEMLFEFCNELKKRYPAMRVKTLCYFHTLNAPSGLKTPENLFLVFCPIYANYLAPLEVEKGQTTLTSLKSWTNQGAHIWYWYYTLPYCGNPNYLFLPPITNLSRLSSDIRTLKKLGVESTYFEHDSGGNDRTNFFELQAWLILKLFQAPEQNTDSLIKEFTDFYYGKAAGIFREYLYDIEKENMRLVQKQRRAVFDTIDFEYLTKENFDKWKQLFNRMEKQVENNPENLTHVKLAKLGMEAAAVTEAAKTSSWAEVEPMTDNLKNEIKFLKEKANYSFDMGRIEKWKAALKNSIEKRKK